MSATTRKRNLIVSAPIPVAEINHDVLTRLAALARTSFDINGGYVAMGDIGAVVSGNMNDPWVEFGDHGHHYGETFEVGAQELIDAAYTIRDLVADIDATYTLALVGHGDARCLTIASGSYVTTVKVVTVDVATLAREVHERWLASDDAIMAEIDPNH